MLVHIRLLDSKNHDHLKKKLIPRAPMTAASAIIWGPDRSTHLKSMSYRITDGDGLLISLHPIGNVRG